jgi:salicylate hydroxylase
VLATLLADSRIKTHSDLETALSVFDESRRERTQWLVESSRFIGDCYEWRAEGVGRNFGKIEEAINTRNAVITEGDVGGMCREAEGLLGRKLDIEKERASL